MAFVKRKDLDQIIKESKRNQVKRSVGAYTRVTTRGSSVVTRARTSRTTTTESGSVPRWG